MSQLEVRIDNGPPRGDLYTLEQTTTFQVVDRQSGEMLLIFQGRMEASLSRSTGTWEGYRFDGVADVRIAAGDRSVTVTYHDGREETLEVSERE